MNVVNPDKSVIRDLLYAWHKKKNIKCPTCKTCVFQYDGTPDFSSVQVKYEIVLIHHSPCPSSVGNCGKGLFFCLSCGGQSSHTFGRLLDRGCKCVGVTKNKDKKSLNQQIKKNNSVASNNDDVGDLRNSNVVSDVNRKNPTESSASYSQYNQAEDHVANHDDVECDFNHSYESVLDMCEDLANNDAVGDKNDTTEDSAAKDNVSALGNKKNPITDSASYSQNNHAEDHVASNYDIGCYFNNSYELASKLSEHFAANPAMGPIYTSPLSILANRKEWSSVSARFFIRDYKNRGDGLRGLVFNSVVDSKNSSDFSSLTVDDMFFHLHIASIHYGISTAKSIDITTMMLHNSSEHNQIIQSERNMLSDAYCNSILQVLTARGIINNQDQEQTILQEINNCVHTEFQSNRVKSCSINLSAPVKHKTVRAVYIDGHNSIVKNLPIPTVGICNKAAYIPAREIINHLLAIGIDVMFFRAGHEEDWVDKSGNYATNFLCDLHQNVSITKDISMDTRVILVRVWSDGFEAHQIKAKNEFNSLQIFTLTVLAPKYQNTNRHTVPFAMCFKRKNHHDILIQLLEELKDLQSPTLRYWGGEENQVYPTMVFLEMISNDLPERCSNTCTTLNGTFTHRWRHSCLFDDNTVPSCQSCHLKNIEFILSPSAVNIKREVYCDRCLDWWSQGVTKPKIYPIQPESFLNEIENFPAVELSFEMIYNSIISLQDWCFSSNSSNAQKGKVIKKYLQAIGFSSQFIQPLTEDLVEGKEASESLGFPSILQKFRTVNVELNSFQTMPMHMCFLGIEKSLIALTSMLANRTDRKQNAAWYKLINAMQGSQETINSVYLVWCLAMKFTDMEKKNLGTANWQSDHYLAFTRVSLFHFSPLDSGDITNNLDKQLILSFRSMRVTWFCFISHIFAEEEVPTETINVLVRLFLSSCRRFWMLGERKNTNVDASSKKSSSGKKRKLDDGKSSAKLDDQKAKKTSTPFYVSKANFLSLLNLGDMIKQSGNMRNCWEGENESYIQNVKREISTMKHNEKYLKTILTKILRTDVLASFNKDNPFSNAKKYSRTSHVRIYNKGLKHSTVDDVFSQEDIVSGVINMKGHLLVCFEESRVKGIGVHPLIFDDVKGTWKCNLWYSETLPQSHHSSVYKSREDLLKDCIDFFILLRERNANNISMRTMICRSWRVRDDIGRLRLPLPLKNVLLMT
jgi:hypothetical protein